MGITGTGMQVNVIMADADAIGEGRGRVPGFLACDQGSVVCRHMLFQYAEDGLDTSAFPGIGVFYQTISRAITSEWSRRPGQPCSPSGHGTLVCNQYNNDRLHCCVRSTCQVNALSSAPISQLVSGIPLLCQCVAFSPRTRSSCTSVR